MGKTPRPGTEDLDPTLPVFPFMEDPANDDPTHAARAPAGAPEGEGEGEGEWEPPTQEEHELDLARIETAEDAAKAARDQAEQNTALVRDLLASQRPPEGEAEPEEPGAMPDAARDPEDFAAWLNKRDAHKEAKFNRAISGMQREMQTTSRANDLFARFVTKYPNMADKRDLVELASRRAGLRPTDPDSRIFEKVIEQLAVLGVPVDAKPEEGEEYEPPPKRRGGRAAGLGGGSGPRRRRRPEPEEKPTDLIDEITQDQVRLGIM